MSATWVDIRTPWRKTEPLGFAQGFGGAILEVSDAPRAARFYGEILGLPRGTSDEGVAFRCGDASVVLAERAAPRVLPDSGTHLALRLTADAVSAACARAEAAGIAVHRYREDRPIEEADPRYLSDPDGNRLQLVAGSDAGIDHAAVETHDLEWSETFYTQVLGGVVEFRVGWRMQDYAAAWAWGEGKDDRAPGTRRWDKRYTTIEGQARMPRPNAHVFVTLGAGVTIGLYLATEHRPEPPPDAVRGTPRLVVTASADGLEALADRLAKLRLRPLRAASGSPGPFERQVDRLFVRDPGGNFLELREG
jgi:catechol 2,3-dioxygenase-like lactoylglutathione lyase family enzyme